MMAASMFVKFTGAPFWCGVLFLGCLGAGLYALDVLLMRHYLRKGAPGLLACDVALPPPAENQSYLWEMTAGTGIVPKWVSWIGISAIACVVGSFAWLALWLGD